MSPLWRDELRIALAPHEVAGVRLARGLRRRAVDKLSLPCAAGDGWQPALASLRSLLEKQRNADALVVLSSHFARYVVVPWSDALASRDELDALARHRFSQVFGAPAAEWEVRVSPGCYGAPMLACGVERGLLDALRQTCSDAGVRLAAVQPALMAVFNRWRGMMQGEGGWLGLAEPGRLTVALLQGGGWQGVHSRQVEGAAAGDLLALLDQERLLADVADTRQTAWLFAPGQPNALPAAGGNWLLRPLRLPAQHGFSPHADKAFSLAMCGGLA